MTIYNKTKIDKGVWGAIIRWVRRACIQEISGTSITDHLFIRYTRQNPLDEIRWTLIASVTRCVSIPEIMIDDGSLFQKENLFQIINAISYCIHPKITPENLPRIRGPIGKLFLDSEPDKLIAHWKTFSQIVAPVDPFKKINRQINITKMMVCKWEKNLKLSTTKLKIWNRKLKAANRAKEKIKQKIEKEKQNANQTPESVQ